MSQVELEEKVLVAWLRATRKDPELLEKYGSNGYRVFLDMLKQGSKEIEIAYLFKVSQKTISRWQLQLQENKVA